MQEEVLILIDLHVDRIDVSVTGLPAIPQRGRVLPRAHRCVRIERFDDRCRNNAIVRAVSARVFTVRAIAARTVRTVHCNNALLRANISARLRPQSACSPDGEDHQRGHRHETEPADEAHPKRRALIGIAQRGCGLIVVFPDFDIALRPHTG